MDWSFQFHEGIGLHLSPPPPPPPPPVSPVSNLESRISPSVLVIIVILAFIFFISGLIHLLLRCLPRPIAREPAEDMDTVTALQGQLQQLFHLHDAGIDQSFIDTLPVFLYKAIIGLKDPFDCAVCLCEFEAEDKLRLLPKCSHAFHLDCIDTWLLSHSTCPLCRRSLLPEFSPPSICSPVLLVLDAGSDTASEGRDSLPNASIASLGDDDASEKLPEIASKQDDATLVVTPEAWETKVVPVKLGKFRSGTVGEGTSSNLDRRRCFSMGSCEYVMDECSLLQVPIKPPKKPATKKPGHRAAMSECDCHSTRERFRGLDSLRAGVSSSNLHLKESLSASKIWLQCKKEKPASGDDSFRRAISFRLPLHTRDGPKLNDSDTASPAGTASEFNVSTWERSCSEVDLDVEVGSCNYSVDDEAPSFARRTLLWLVGRQKNKGGDHL